MTKYQIAQLLNIDEAEIRVVGEHEYQNRYGEQCVDAAAMIGIYFRTFSINLVTSSTYEKKCTGPVLG